MATEKNLQDPVFPLAIVTGAARGIGKAAAELLALQKTYNVILVVRDVQRGLAVEEELRKIWPNVYSIPCADLGSYKSVLDMKTELQNKRFPNAPVKILINCAAECPETQVLKKHFRKTVDAKDQKIYEDSVDAQFSSNVLAYHFMIKEFVQNSDRGTAANIVNVASDWAGDVDLDDLSFTRRKYDNDTAYRQSKALNRMLTKQWSEYFEKDDAMDVDIKNPNKIVVNSCHPGDPCTKLSTALGYNLYASKDCKSSCKSIMYLATEAKTSGGWYEADGSKQYCKYMSDKFRTQRQKLWDICESFVIGNLD